MPTKRQRLIASLPGLTWLALGLALFCWRDLFWILGAWRPVVLELFLLAFGSAFMLSLRAWLLFPPEAPNHQIAWQLSEGTSSCFLVSLGMFMGTGIVSAICVWRCAGDARCRCA